MQADPIETMRLKGYVLYAIATTLVVAVFPLLVAYRLAGETYSFPLLATTAIATTLSIVLGRVGARLWQYNAGSRDVVFDDLLIWGFFRRLLNARKVLKNVERMATGMSRDQHVTVLKDLAKALESGDPYTQGHSNRVARHAYMVARSMKLPRRQRDQIRLAAALHDVGKLRTPRSILSKPARLSDEEYEVIKRHPGDGADMVAALNDEELTAIVRHHHERMDGNGYPDRIPGDAIPIGARIIAVADTFDAITSKRPYRPTRKHKDAIDILLKESGTQLDADIVKAFITYYTGRRGIRLWLTLGSSMPRFLEVSLTGLQRAAASAAVVGGAVLAVAGGVALTPASEPTDVATAAARSGAPVSVDYEFSATANAALRGRSVEATKERRDGSRKAKEERPRASSSQTGSGSGAGAIDVGDSGSKTDDAVTGAGGVASGDDASDDVGSGGSGSNSGSTSEDEGSSDGDSGFSDEGSDDGDSDSYDSDDED